MGISPTAMMHMTRLMESPKPSIGKLEIKMKTGAAYEIYLKDHLDSYWFEWFEGWTITNLDHAQVRLTCANVDPSGLHGALNKIRDLNLTLISVRRMEEESQE
jgi:hypothetical protein